jgi:hypothetical protein
VFNVPKSDVEVIRGAKTRDKVVCISGLDIGRDTEDAFLQKAQRLLAEEVVA